MIKNGTVVNADSTDLSDVLIANGKIVDVGREIVGPAECDVIDAKGKYVLPGGIDPNTRLEVDFRGVKPKDDFYSGTRAGVAGGTTMVLDLVVPKIGELLSMVNTVVGRLIDSNIDQYSLDVTEKQGNSSKGHLNEEVI